MNAVRANAAGLGISPTRSVGPASAAIVPDTRNTLGRGWDTVMSVGCPAGTVMTWERTVKALVCGR
jgi:hypothetical protein